MLIKAVADFSTSTGRDQAWGQVGTRAAAWGRNLAWLQGQRSVMANTCVVDDKNRVFMPCLCRVESLFLCACVFSTCITGHRHIRSSHLGAALWNMLSRIVAIEFSSITAPKPSKRVFAHTHAVHMSVLGHIIIIISYAVCRWCCISKLNGLWLHSAQRPRVLGGDAETRLPSLRLRSGNADGTRNVQPLKQRPDTSFSGKVFIWGHRYQLAA